MTRIAIGVILLFVSLWAQGKEIIIQKLSVNTVLNETIQPKSGVFTVAFLASPKVIGKYSQSLYNVSLSTLIALRNNNFELIRYDLEDESSQSLLKALKEAKEAGSDAIMAPLTAAGAQELIALSPEIPVFIPTVHKRDFSYAPDYFIFGAIDYKAQIEALIPYMGDTVSIFYDASSVGTQLKSITEEVLTIRRGTKNKIVAYPVDLKGEKIMTHLSKPAVFSKSSIILHIPVVKSAILTSHLTFVGAKERNILSTQINYDPTLLTLTQNNDRKNMILANSLIDFPPKIYESNALHNNDISFDWIQYATSVGIDYLLATYQNTPREYSMRLINSQIIYPVELMRAKEFGFEPLRF